MNHLSIENTPRRRWLRDERGSALIIALIFAAALAGIVLPSYLKLSRSTLDLADRNYYRNAALSLAESGLEHAIWALNQASEGNTPWNDWDIDGSNAKSSVSNFSYGGNIVGDIEIHLLNYDSSTPEVVTMATIHLSNGQPVRRYMYAQLEASSVPATGGGLFAYGMLARDFIHASGGASFDSWKSNPSGDGSSFTPYSNGVARDQAAIAVASSAANAIMLGSSDVYGTAAIGSADHSGLNVGWGGQVGPKDPSAWDPSDTKDLWARNPPGWLVSTATGALTTNFAATFEDITVPETLTPVLRSPYILPRTIQVLKSNQSSSWYENQYVSTDTIGETGKTTILQMDSLKVEGGATLTVAGNVTMILPNADQNSLQVIAGGKLVLAEGAQLTVYTAGNTVIAGAGLMNQFAPKQLQIWGTNPTSQSITFQGSGSMSGVIYAPNAAITLPGGTHLYGAVVGKSISMSGSGAFHYDESLKDIDTWTGNNAGDVPIGGERALVQRVAEITADAFAGHLGS